jgi:hypothetical protein
LPLAQQVWLPPGDDSALSQSFVRHSSKASIVIRYTAACPDDASQSDSLRLVQIHSNCHTEAVTVLLGLIACRDGPDRTEHTAPTGLCSTNDVDIGL